MKAISGLRSSKRPVLPPPKARAVLLLIMACLVGSGLWLMRPRTSGHARPNGIYTAQGFGGYVRTRPVPSPVGSKRYAADALQAAADAYAQGHYKEAEAAAQKMIASAEGARPGSAASRKALQAQQLAAYSAARRNDFALAQARFAALRDTASEQPDHGQPPFQFGEPQPTLEEEAAYEHAVCTGKVQGQQAAEVELSRFLCRYPQSLLIQAAVKRIARYHGGDLPRPVEKRWQQAMRLQKQVEQRREREASLCGPECLAELLRRRGQKADVHALADAMGTTEKGTSLAGLAKVAKQHGFSPRGLLLSERGLQQQRLPAIAWADLGHFVLVEAVSPESVVVWDPDALGLHHPGIKRYSIADWQKRWTGYTLALR